DGTRPLTATFTLGPTGTSRFGSGGSVSVKFNVNRIPQVPSKPSRSSASSITSSSAKITWSAPASNGARMEDYQMRIAGVDVANTGTTRTHIFRGLSPNTSYVARVRAKNSAGWGDYSADRSFTTKVASPTAPTNVSASRVNDGRHTITWTRRSSSAAPYSSQRVQRRRWVNGAWGNWSTVATVSGTTTSYT